MKNQTGYTHIYCGNGKGKTTTAMGLCMRAAGHGFKVLIYQFMKDNSTSERNILKNIPNVILVEGLEDEKFSFQLSDEEKKERKEYYEKQFQKLIDMAREDDVDVIFFDELIYTIRAGLFDEKLLLEFLKNKPEKLEIILTGQGPSDALLDAADYVSEICKRKHPFDRGIASRKGIEK